MTLFLSSPETLGQHPQAEPIQVLHRPRTIALTDASAKSYGYQQTVTLRPGLNVRIDDYTLEDDLIVEMGDSKLNQPSLKIEMSFMLSGHNHEKDVAPHHNVLSAAWCNPDGEKFYWQAGERVLKFDIHIDSALFEALVDEQFNTLPPPLRQLVQTPHPIQQQFWHVQPTTAAMQAAIHQILHCPYQGLIRWLYWESRVIELIALQLDQVSRSRPVSWLAPGLRSEDVDRIHHASDILLQRLTNPPSLLELARLVGLNDYKLKRGFRRVFGTTVFGYLQTHRMERAKQLLAQPNFNIAGVAQAIGYANQSHFCQMFKRQFGMTPRYYRSSLRG